MGAVFWVEINEDEGSVVRVLSKAPVIITVSNSSEVEEENEEEENEMWSCTVFGEEYDGEDEEWECLSHDGILISPIS
jgi:hypothetical protein